MIAGKLVIGLIFVTAATACHAQSPSIVAPGAEVKKLVGDFQFTEGPAGDAACNVYFSDIPNNRILKWSLDGKLSTFLENSGGANGLYFDKGGNLLACQESARRLVSISPTGEITVLADQYNGKKFNSPNGLIGTPNGRRLYVADHGAGKTYSYRINADGTLSNKQLFAPAGSDGMTLDNRGNVYLTGKVVSVYSRRREKVAEIPVPEGPANVTFAGVNNQTLFITARTSLYAIVMAVKGAPTPVQQAAKPAEEKATEKATGQK